MNVDYDRIDEYPEKVNAVTVVLRLLDGLGFRFQWPKQAGDIQLQLLKAQFN